MIFILLRSTINLGTITSAFVIHHVKYILERNTT
jgi:hypothetical protein